MQIKLSLIYLIMGVYKKICFVYTQVIAHFEENNKRNNNLNYGRNYK